MKLQKQTNCRIFNNCDVGRFNKIFRLRFCSFIPTSNFKLIFNLNLDTESHDYICCIRRI